MSNANGQLAPERLDELLSTVALCGGNREQAARLLGMRKDKVHAVVKAHPAEYEQRRQQLAPAVAAKVAGDMLDNANAANVAIARLIELAVANAEFSEDPGRAARDLSQVMAQAIDKRLALQGRPTQIVEHRDIAEIVRALVSKGVVEVIDSTAVEEGAT